MSTEVVFLEQLLIVVGHPDEVELGESIRGMNSSGMHVSVNEALVMDVGKCLTHLANMQSISSVVNLFLQ